MSKSSLTSGSNSGLPTDAELDKREKEPCVICGKEGSYPYWVYIWKGKEGYACDPCGRWFHETGEYLMQAVGEFCKKNGIEHAGWKEKYGSWRFSPFPKTEADAVKIKGLQKLYSALFPEFEWDFD